MDKSASSCSRSNKHAESASLTARFPSKHLAYRDYSRLTVVEKLNIAHRFTLKFKTTSLVRQKTALKSYFLPIFKGRCSLHKIQNTSIEKLKILNFGPLFTKQPPQNSPGYAIAVHGPEQTPHHLRFTAQILAYAKQVFSNIFKVIVRLKQYSLLDVF